MEQSQAHGSKAPDEADLRDTIHQVDRSTTEGAAAAAAAAVFAAYALCRWECAGSMQQLGIPPAA